MFLCFNPPANAARSLQARRGRTPGVLLAPSMPRTFRPSKSPTRTRDSVENVERPLAPAEAPPSRDAAAMGPKPRVALESPEEKALASRRHQEVMARSKSPPRQLRPQAMPKIAAPVSCAEAGYHSRPNRTHSAEGSCLSAGHHPRLWAARHTLEGRWGTQARTSRASAEQPQLIAHTSSFHLEVPKAARTRLRMPCNPEWSNCLPNFLPSANLYVRVIRETKHTVIEYRRLLGDVVLHCSRVRVLYEIFLGL